MHHQPRRQDGTGTQSACSGKAAWGAAGYSVHHINHPEILLLFGHPLSPSWSGQGTHGRDLAAYERGQGLKRSSAAKMQLEGEWPEVRLSRWTVREREGKPRHKRKHKVCVMFF